MERTRAGRQLAICGAESAFKIVQRLCGRRDEPWCHEVVPRQRLAGKVAASAKADVGAS